MSTPRPYSATQQKFGRVVIKWMSRANTALYRMTKGKVGGRFIKGTPVCLLTTTGRKSGLRRTVPLLFMRDGDDVVLVASQGGMPDNPDWYLNIVDDPKVELQFGSDIGSYESRTADPAERAALWPKLVALYADYDDYQQRASGREIPVVICTPNR